MFHAVDRAHGMVHFSHSAHRTHTNLTHCVCMLLCVRVRGGGRRGGLRTQMAPQRHSQKQRRIRGTQQTGMAKTTQLKLHLQVLRHLHHWGSVAMRVGVGVWVGVCICLCLPACVCVTVCVCMSVYVCLCVCVCLCLCRCMSCKWHVRFLCPQSRPPYPPRHSSHAAAFPYSPALCALPLRFISS